MYRGSMPKLRWFVMSIVSAGSGCGPSPDISHVAPAVRAAVPPGLGGTGAAFAPALDPGDIKGRFFGDGGPTEVFGILDQIDRHIDELNNSNGDCVNQAPVTYTLDAWGHTVSAIAQCSMGIGADTFVQYGTDDNGETDIYTKDGDPRVFAHVAPIAGAPGKHAVHAWLVIGARSPSCAGARGSYGVIELQADESTKAFEMTVAGTGFGYCGAQLKSDGTSVYFTGSPDMGACAATETVCGAASDVTLPAICGASVTTFALPPAGRLAGCDYGASDYPGGAGDVVNLDGTSGDSVESFGLATPTPGVGSL